jgi:glutamyl/glutaminyl-tRNA synthetase
LGKLRWLNKTKIKREEPRSLLAISKPFAGRYRSHLENLAEERQLVLISIIRDNLGTLADVEDEMKPFFEYISEELSGMSEYPARAVAEAFLPLCENEDFKAVCGEVSETTGAKGKKLYMPIRAGLTGRLHGPELGKIYSWFAPEERKARIKMFLEHI